MNIIEITTKHRAEVLEMVQDFYSGEAVDHPVNPVILERTFDDVANPENNTITGYLIMEEGEIAGYCYLTSLYACEVGGICILIEEIHIKAEYRGKGLGRAAMEWVRAQNPEAKRFRLEVTDANRGAVALYQKLGYQFLNYKQMTLDME